MSTATINNADIYYEERGQGPALVLAHGFAADGRTWNSQADFFAGQFRVIRYDLRGFGRSSLPAAEPYSHFDDLKGLLDHLAVDRAHVMGLSLGGQVATDFALSYPERIDRLILVDAVLGGHHFSDAWTSQVRPCWQKGRAGELAAARRQWLKNDNFQRVLAHPAAGPLFRQMSADYSGWHWQYSRQDPEVVLDPPAAGRLAQISAPTLVVVGAEDGPDFQAIAARLAAEIPGAVKVTIAGAAHMSNMEAPAAFNAAVSAFLSR